MNAPTGRPPFEPKKEHYFVVVSMVACGFQQRVIAEMLGIDKKTMRKYFRRELKEGVDVANAHMAQSLFKKGMGNGPQSVTAAIWWEKTRAGRKETVAHEHTGKDGAPIETKALPMSPEEAYDKMLKAGR